MGASCCAICTNWFACKSHILAVLSHDAVNTLVPSWLQQALSIGASWFFMALGTVLPLSSISQQRISLAHDVPIKKV
ncbi:hypothetical protein BpHYR1_009007 [Brachionus plicatilis]|uniref:Uncharacterized protein n=1 Tax=Brachionus plicatilis TaxID=10195 RepID=A0A3M7QD02_BRAPC|nr:hypothetical protein BpHYR1_009007 [Brachionus plicatilis]